MAMIRCDHFSDALEQGMTTTVVLPQPSDIQIGATARTAGVAPPVLYLLHGLSDDASAWIRYTSIERYATEAGLAVVMPQVHRSFYTDIPRDGGAYWSYLSDELPRIVAQFFQVSAEPARTFVAGLSMGGFGAIKWALHQPDRFDAVASLSGPLDLEALVALGDRADLFAAVLAGRTLAATGNDLFALAEATDPARAPRMLIACGEDDTRLLSGNQRFAADVSARGFDVTESYSPGGHEWSYWDARIRNVVTWLSAG